jgi:multiple sugar transport system ATP-binding protein
MPFTIESEIEIVEPMGADTIAWTKIGGQSLTFRAASEVHLEPGQKVTIGFDPARGSVFNADSGERV